MPVEIKELVVRGKMEGSKESPKSPPPSNPMGKEDANAKISNSLRKQIVDQCVQEVLEKLKIMNEF